MTSRRKLSWAIYAILAFVFVSSYAFVSLYPASTAMKIVGGMPGVLSLLGVLFQLVRDDAQYQRSILLQHDQQQFDLGVTSHMADVAFDRHVMFCEEYVSEMNETISTLFKEGPTEQALRHAGNLHRVRLKHAAWLTPKMESQLDPFEAALRTIGAAAHMYTVDPGNANARGAVDRMHAVFSDVLGIERIDETSMDSEVAVTAILARLRTVLGIQALTSMRQKLLKGLPADGA